MTTSTTLPARRRPRGMYPKGRSVRRSSGDKRLAQLPEYLEASEIDALMAAAPHAKARLLMLIQWRAGLRVSEALGIEVRDLALEGEHPTIRVRHGKGHKARLVPVHPELSGALRSALAFNDIGRGSKIIKVSRATASRWVVKAVDKVVQAGAIPPGRKISTHTLRHSYARHLLAHGIPINALSRWLGHSSIDTTLIYLELFPDPRGTLAAVP